MISSISRRFASWRAAAGHVAIIAVVLAAVGAGAQSAERAITADTPDATRAELTARLDSLVRSDSQGGGKPAQQRERAAEIAAVRTRLADGDFATGERFLIDFGATERSKDTVIVRDSSNISLSNWPSYSLRGVLRSELQAAVERYVAIYVREPRLRVTALTRIVIVGGVGRPGVYNFESSRPVSDALMAAGGTGQSGRSDKITIYRGASRIIDEGGVTAAVRDGTTIATLGLRSGDEIRVPIVQARRNWRSTIQPIFFTVSILAAVLAIIRASYTP